MSGKQRYEDGQLEYYANLKVDDWNMYPEIFGYLTERERQTVFLHKQAGLAFAEIARDHYWRPYHPDTARRIFKKAWAKMRRGIRRMEVLG